MAVGLLMAISAPFSQAQNLAELENRAVGLFEQGEYAQAQEAVQQVLGLLTDGNGNCNSVACAEWLQASYTLYYLVDDYENALEVLFRLRPVLAAVHGEGSTEVTMIIDNAADLLYALGRYEQAKDGYLEVRSRWAVNPGKQSEEYLIALDDLIDVFIILGEPAEAIELAKERAETTGIMFGFESLDYLAELELFGEMAYDAGFFDVSVDFFLKAKSIYEAWGDTDDEDYRELLESLIFSYVALDDFDGKKLAFEALIASYRSALDDPEALAEVVQIYAQMLRENGLYEEGEAALRDLLETETSLFGENSIAVVKTMGQLGIHYLEWGLLQNAMDFFDRAHQLARQFEDELQLLAETTNNMATIHLRLGNFQEAENLFANALQLLEEMDTPDNDLYISTVNNLSIVYRETMRFRESIELLESLKAGLQDALGEGHPQYATFYANLGSVYMLMGDYKTAEGYYQKGLGLLKSSNLTNINIYPVLLINLGRLYMDTGDLEAAESLILEALEIRKRTHGPQSFDYAESLVALSQLYLLTNRHAENLTILGETLALLEPTQPYYATILITKGQAYKSMADYETAASYFELAIEASARIYGESHPSYFTAIDYLGLMYLEAGDVITAERYIGFVLSQRADILGDGHPEYYKSLNNMGLVYRDLGDYDRALPLFTEAADHYRTVYGDSHPHLVEISTNIGISLYELGYLDEAGEAFQKALEMAKSLYGERNMMYINNLNSLGLVYRLTGRIEEGIAMLEEADRLYQAIYPIGRISYPATLNNLAYSHLMNGDAKTAIGYMQRAVALQQEITGELHPQLAVYMLNLAEMHGADGDHRTAMDILKKASEIDMKFLTEVSRYLTEAQQEAYIQKYQVKVQYYTAKAHENIGEMPELATWSLELQYALKGLMLTNNRAMTAALRESGDESLLAMFGEWRSLMQVIANQYSLPTDSRRPDLPTLVMEAEDIEKDLVMLSTEFGGLLSQTTAGDVAQSLHDGQAAVEFSYFPSWNEADGDYDFLYVAWVVRNGIKDPVFVELFFEEDLEAILRAARSSSDIQTVQGLYRTITAGAPTAVVDGPGLYELVWQKLEPLLDGVSEVFIAPSGQLHRLSFAAIRDGDGAMLSDRYRLNRLTSTRVLGRATDGRALTGAPKVALFGGIDYEQADPDGSDLPAVGGIGLQPPAGLARGSVWDFLPGTKQEVELLSGLFSENGGDVMVYKGGAASEEALKSLQGDSSPEILHIATHGFFFPDPDPAAISSLADGRGFRLAENPMLRSGLAFAGANTVWRGDERTGPNEDGILTAMEASRLDLGNTKLLVLSACETGLGDIMGSEGVFGLQRAFMLAGVEYLILSLWQVPDKETVELMEYFYRHLLDGKGVREAFHHARETMKQKHEPFYWAAFELIE